MRILDNQPLLSIFKRCIICYLGLLALVIVIDAFSNLDEFAKRADGFVEMSQVMSRYYLLWIGSGLLAILAGLALPSVVKH